MRKKAKWRPLRLTRDNVNSYLAKQYIGPRIFCFRFLKYMGFFGFILFLSFFLSVLFFLPFLF